MADEDFSLVELNDTNYTMWKCYVILALESADLMNHIDETEEWPYKGEKKHDWEKSRNFSQ